ncbi:hypothetical protein QAD02_016007 [Eretmocerus hayati]|uniref:Uncharacterized protein n=1 Tax=Eretmocerus hayati TaxID=131215 RepID=A0ACC2PEM9_9HYME|nr:hypothetical protein QAD02_016007 [Eretmocerus hayati]
MDSPARPTLQSKMASSTGGTEGLSPASSPASAASLAAMAAAPKFGTLVPNRIFVGGISASTSEAELAQLFSAYGNVKATKIIADRGGVSKGYGFVTFETEEEAKRLQQESECIILRERKLNIAPAIKKQPFNRSFDGGTGSPPTVPTSTYYYTNGMGVPYQNSMTFYNAGAPAPGAAIAPPTDPTTLYQTPGVFGPQATPSHQPFAPMMYPVPAPSLYMPQQYQFSPMPYEPYYPGAAGSGAPPPYLYGSGTNQASPGPVGGNVGGNGVGGGGGNSASNGVAGGGGSSGSTTTGTTSPGGGGSGSVPGQFGTHFYGPTSHHSLGGGFQQPSAQLDHLYYPYSAQSQPPPAGPQSSSSTQPAHQQQHQLGITTSDQLQLVYTADMVGQLPGGSELQPNQSEDTPSIVCHLEQLQLTSTTESAGGFISQSSESSGTAAAPLVKYPVSSRYTNIHSLPSHSQQHRVNNADSNVKQQSLMSEEVANNATHYRSMSVYSGPVYMYPPPGGSANPNAGPSLLPTPPQPPFDLSSTGHPKYREYGSKPFVKSAPPLPGQPHHNPSAYARHYSGQALSQQQPQPSHHQAKFGPGTRTSIYPQQHQQQQPQLQHYGRRGPAPGVQQHPTHHLSGSPAYYFPHKQSGSRPGQQQPFLSSYAAPTRNHPSHEHYAAGGNGRRSFGSDITQSSHSQPQLSISEVRHSGRSRQFVAGGSRSAPIETQSFKLAHEDCSSSSKIEAVSESDACNNNIELLVHGDSSVKNSLDVAQGDSANENSKESCENPLSIKSSHSSGRHSPNPSPSLSQPIQDQLSNLGNVPQEQCTISASCELGAGKNTEPPEQSRNEAHSENKVNGLVQTLSDKPSEERSDGLRETFVNEGVLPTPPATPLQSTITSDTQSHQSNDSCHQLQTLSL